MANKISRAQSASITTSLILLKLCILALIGTVIYLVVTGLYGMGVLFYVLGIFGAIFCLWCAVFGYSYIVPSNHMTEGSNEDE